LGRSRNSKAGQRIRKIVERQERRIEARKQAKREGRSTTSVPTTREEELKQQLSARNPADVRAGIDASKRDMSLAGQATGTEEQIRLAAEYEKAASSGDVTKAKQIAESYSAEAGKNIEQRYEDVSKSRQFNEAAKRYSAGEASDKDLRYLARYTDKSSRELQQTQKSLRAVQKGKAKAGDVIKVSREIPAGPERQAFVR